MSEPWKPDGYPSEDITHYASPAPDGKSNYPIAERIATASQLSVAQNAHRSDLARAERAYETSLNAITYFLVTRDSRDTPVACDTTRDRQNYYAWLINQPDNKKERHEAFKVTLYAVERLK